MSHVSSALSRKWFTVGVAISLSAATFAKPLSMTMDEPWHAEENPDSIGIRMNYQLGDIYKGSLSQAEVKRVPWTSSFWPTFKASIAHRPSDGPNTAWGSQAPGFHNTLQSSDSLAATAARAEKDPKDPSITIYSGGALDRSAPVEKLDIAVGRADGNLSAGDFYANTSQVREWGRSVVRSAPDQIRWHGLCNGFAAASIHTTEPKAVDYLSKVYVLSDGRKARFRVRFGSGDLKALASFQYAMKTWDADHPGFHQVGLNNCDRATGVGCRGLNAGSFHVLMTNVVGRLRQSLVFDADASQEFWNYPVVGYEIASITLRRYRNEDGSATKWARPNVAPGATHDVRVVMNTRFMSEADWNMSHFGENNRQKIFTNTYDYLLELNSGADGIPGNADDEVLGGTWLSQLRPHFAWRLDAPIEYSGDYQLLNSLWTNAWPQGQ
jgi:hypothetical protein